LLLSVAMGETAREREREREAIQPFCQKRERKREREKWLSKREKVKLENDPPILEGKFVV